jgi:hypothetical protein
MFKVGDSVLVNGYPGVVATVHAHDNGVMAGMIDVRFDHGQGSVCVDASDALPGEVWLQICKMAASDLRKARKEGSILISDTKHGSVELRYVFTEKSFEIHKLGIDARHIMTIEANKKAPEKLAPIYRIEVG